MTGKFDLEVRSRDRQTQADLQADLANIVWIPRRDSSIVRDEEASQHVRVEGPPARHRMSCRAASRRSALRSRGGRGLPPSLRRYHS
jgi:hypothetical protein